MSHRSRWGFVFPRADQCNLRDDRQQHAARAVLKFQVHLQRHNAIDRPVFRGQHQIRQRSLPPTGPAEPARLDRGIEKTDRLDIKGLTQLLLYLLLETLLVIDRLIGGLRIRFGQQVREPAAFATHRQRVANRQPSAELILVPHVGVAVDL